MKRGIPWKVWTWYRSIKESRNCYTVKNKIFMLARFITVCTNCSRDKDITASLRLKLEKKESELCYWQDCYETLLQQHFEDDRRGYDVTHKRV